MTQHRMRLVEQLIEEDSGDFIVEAPTPALAAGILLRAARCRPASGAATSSPCRMGNPAASTRPTWSKTAPSASLLDEAGQEIKEVEPEWDGAHGRRAAADTRRSAYGAAQASITEPGP